MIRAQDMAENRTERLRSGVFSAERDGHTHLMAWPHHISLPASHRTTEVIAALAGTGQPAGANDPVTEQLRREGWLDEQFSDDCGLAFVVRPLRARRPVPAVGGQLDLSRYAVIRAEAGALLVESPLASAEITIHRRKLLADAFAPATDSAAASDGLAVALREQLLATGFLADSDGEQAQELRYRQWAPHELLFHDRSRLGYRGYVGDGFGGTWWGRLAGFAPEPAVPPPYPGPRVGLAVPDLTDRRLSEGSYLDVIERRRSERVHDDESLISVDQLGELLYRTARVRRLHEEDGVEFVSSPRPSGGSVYELELYPVVTRCSGLGSGLYHYDAHRHELELVRPVDHYAVRRMLRVASQGSTSGAVPQVLLVVAARVGRVMWKYEGMGYAVVLKNTGVLFHALAGTCSAMGLAGCPLGTDDAVAFTEATDRDPLVECSVGQFIVGSSFRLHEEHIR
ncbi:SagB/ThcOx family dehydrogenase [Pseudonocardia sp. EV170527-09]|uniref:SagB family peptide dehydrogenase n=1 Tax=Pseudonocardia sp. EV170527-09 TaxID=2603411 RepID=UPI0011F22002|nr:SagB family peptide dehydrogenase [Pseudonocardia sp. EV170527-09]KAA1017587.1 SagB/ThcOx family dehydrogenase [Pseudonocardia sp. EV170527-09]